MRKVITPTLRFQVLNRDGFFCQYCWLKAGDWVQLQVDHKISVKNWWGNDIENLITSCFQCNIWKWKKNLEEVHKKLSDIKISENIKKHLYQFYDMWNIKSLGTIDNNTKALLNIYFGYYLWWKNYYTYLDVPWIYQEYIWKEWKELNTDDYIKLEKIFNEWWEYCDNVLLQMVCPSGNYLNTEFADYEFLRNLLNDSRWLKTWKCYDNYNNRLNYILSEALIDLYNEWELKNNYSIKKFSYFFNEINNG